MNRAVWLLTCRQLWLPAFKIRTYALCVVLHGSHRLFSLSVLSQRALRELIIPKEDVCKLFRPLSLFLSHVQRSCYCRSGFLYGSRVLMCWLLNVFSEEADDAA
jgi:hypothetical protein